MVKVDILFHTPFVVDYTISFTFISLFSPVFTFFSFFFFFLLPLSSHYSHHLPPQHQQADLLPQSVQLQHKLHEKGTHQTQRATESWPGEPGRTRGRDRAENHPMNQEHQQHNFLHSHRGVSGRMWQCQDRWTDVLPGIPGRWEV